MPDLALNWATALPLMIAVLALLTTLILSVPAAFAEESALHAVQAQGRFMEPIRADGARGVKRRELIGAVEQLIVVIGIAISFVPIPDVYHAVMLRNVCFCILSILALANTVLDHAVRRRALRFAESERKGAARPTSAVPKGP